MKKMMLKIFFVIFALTMFLSPSFSQVTAIREFRDTNYTPGEMIRVDIKISGEEGAYTLTETPPSGWIISRVPLNAVITDSGSLQWELSLTGNDITVFYLTTPPDDANDKAIFSGLIGNKTIEGDIELAPPPPLPTPDYSYNESTGLFDSHFNFTFNYDSDTGIYLLSNLEAGDDVFLYKEMYGDFTVRARMDFIDPPTWTWCYIAVKNTPTLYFPEDMIWWVLMSSNEANDGGSRSGRIPGSQHDKWFEIIRDGNTFTLSYFSPIENDWIIRKSLESLITDPIYVGIGMGTNPGTSLSTARFSDVEIITPSATKNWALH